MTAPNIVAVATITGKTVVLLNPTTSPGVSLIPTPVNQVFKINSIYACNTTTGPLTIDVAVSRSSGDLYIAKALGISGTLTTIVVSKESAIYMEEGDVVFAKGSASGITFTASYEIIA